MSVKRAAGSRAHHDRTAYRFSILAARQTRCLSEMYAQIFDLSVSQWKVLPIIGYYGPMSAKEVGERTSLEPEKVTRAVDQLVVRGLVTRRSDPKDRRRVFLSLAANGKRVFEESEQLRGIIEDKFLGVLQPKERLAFHRILDKLEDRAMVMFDGKQAWRRIIGGRTSTQTNVRAKTRERQGEE
jgi:DNA-binding MarR family transcriptional regulator